jgi:hypothetical protein
MAACIDRRGQSGERLFTGNDRHGRELLWHQHPNTIAY